MAGDKNRWVVKTWEKILQEFGGQCAHCEKLYDLEFAHLQPTGLKGKGRGKARRLRDILRNPSSYILLCWECHDLFDGRAVRRRQSLYSKIF